MKSAFTLALPDSLVMYLLLFTWYTQIFKFL